MVKSNLGCCMGGGIIVKNKYFKSSLMLFILCLVTWQAANYFSSPGEMDRITSIALMSFLGTVLFLFTTVILLLVALYTKIKKASQ